jgi:site-specific DNA-methyltransferase (adenine-specific)/site-specific DNA-methyltransferase (cytosine-N4-specific)
MVPVGDWAKKRLANLSEKDQTRDLSAVGSNFGKNVSNWIGRKMVYPTNVMHMATECSNKNHSAVFPVDLPEWFIKLFTQEDDIVLDTFAGSGTTAVACAKLNRKYMMIDIIPEFKEEAEQRLLKNGLYANTNQLELNIG